VIDQVKQAVLSKYSADPSGLSWFPRFAEACRTLYDSEQEPTDIGILSCEPKLNYKMNPSREFLGWLIEHPELIVKHTPTEKRNRSMDTHQKREALFSGCEKTKAQATAALKRFSGSLKGEWWRFEGPIEFDIVLLSDSTFFAINLATPFQSWPENPRYPQRHYFFRSLDCAMAFAELTHRRHFFVAHLTETDEEVEIQNAIIEQILSDHKNQIDGLPHLTHEERRSLMAHFLGSQSIGKALAIRSSDRKVS
jgi:hypothetical protein